VVFGRFGNGDAFWCAINADGHAAVASPFIKVADKPSFHELGRTAVGLEADNNSNGYPGRYLSH
jgi:hypothetical protein